MIWLVLTSKESACPCAAGGRPRRSGWPGPGCAPCRPRSRRCWPARVSPSPPNQVVWWKAEATRCRGARRGGGLDQHRRTLAVRLSRPRRGVGVPVLWAGGGARHGVPADPRGDRPRPGRRGRHGQLRRRDPGREQPARRRLRRPCRQAHAGGRARCPPYPGRVRRAAGVAVCRLPERGRRPWTSC